MTLNVACAACYAILYDLAVGKRVGTSTVSMLIWRTEMCYFVAKSKRRPSYLETVKACILHSRL